MYLLHLPPQRQLKKLLKQFTEEEKEAKTEYEEAITKFEETWDEKLANEH